MKTMRLMTFHRHGCTRVARCIAVGLLLGASASTAMATPTGGQWETGTGTINNSGGDLTITPNFNNSIMSWVGFDIGIGPYSPFSTFSDGQGLQMYDFVKREVYEANYEAWTTDRTYPRQYFFNDHPNAGARSFDYVYSLIGVVTGAFYACMLVCLVPMQLKALCSGGDPSGGIQAEI